MQSKKIKMILAFDVSYQETTAKSVCIAFHSWTDERASQTFIQHIDGVEEYHSGEFYKRELPCILKVLENIDLNLVETIIVDGYVILNDEGKYGLGGHLFESLQKKIPIVGVAKTNFANNSLHVRPVLRGQSAKPLYVTAIGIDLEKAADLVENMHGEFRLPTLLKAVDSVTRA